MTQAKNCLTEDPYNSKAYRNLLDGIFCSVMIFNKRRVGEMQRMTLETFLKNYESIPSLEFEKALTKSEKLLYRSLKRIVIRGKRGRGVPVLFDKTTVEFIDFLISARKNFDLLNNQYLFGLPGTSNPLAGYIVMRKHAELALQNKERASLLTSTKLRKHLATITQIFKMEKNELEQLATFMGHTEKTHSEFYRLPDDVYQTAKISKILLLSKGGAFEKFKGKRLEEIEIDDMLIEEESEDDDDENKFILDLPDDTAETSKKNKENMVTLDNNKHDNEGRINKKKGAKRTLVPWTNQQKKIAEDFFRRNIKKKIPPRKNDVDKMVDQHPNIFNNKTWQVIKVFVCNKFKSNK